MVFHTKQELMNRKKPSLIINMRPKEQTRRAQVQLANFLWDQSLSEEEQADEIREMLDALGIRACVKGCCR